MKIGIDLGGSHIGLGVIDEKNNIVEKFDKDFTKEDKDNIKTVIENFIIDKVQELENRYDIENIGIAVPGIAKDGVIIRTVNLGIYNYNMAKALKEKLNKKITIRNDAKCACIAEYENIIKNEPELKDSNMLFLTLGTGIGGGFIYNGKLIEGHAFEGYEFGHMIIKENGIPCKCGKSGCFEKYASILEYKNKVKQRLNIWQEVNGEPLRKIMNEHIDEILDINKQYVKDLSIGISNLINIFEPDLVVLGGGYSHFSYLFEKDLKNELINSALLFNRREEIDLRTAKLGNDAGIIGATIY